MVRLVELLSEETYAVFVFGQEKYWKDRENKKIKEVEGFERMYRCEQNYNKCYAVI